MKLLFVFVFVVVVFCACGNSFQEENGSVNAGSVGPSSSPFQTVVVTGRTVNLRQGPGTQYAIVGSARAGDSLMVTGETPDWYKVYVPEKSLFAWIYSGLTSEAVMPR